MSAESPAASERWECADEESPPPLREKRSRRCLCATPYERGDPQTPPPSPLPAGEPSRPPAPASPPSPGVSRPPAEGRRAERVRAQAERERAARVNGLGRNVLAERAEGMEAVLRRGKRLRRAGDAAGGKRRCLG